ncbi:type II toxin-antitoxin system RelE/ParE family toxin [Granulicella rosea]|uniref:type II toxin-antitoxin system RelE/ParE family toxin n=1 Tax=Granulicella rosea TaxID=474952 RepID=UPI003CCC1952
MIRYVLSDSASRDLDEILSYFDSLPVVPATRGGESIVQMLNSIAENPYLGTTHGSLARSLGFEVRSRFASPYRFYYRLGGRYPEIIAVLHASRDIRSILAQRFQ